MTRRNRSRNVIIEEVECHFETENALKVRIAGLEQIYWIPRKFVAPHSEVSGRGDEGRLIIPAWLAMDKSMPIG